MQCYKLEKGRYYSYRSFEADAAVQYIDKQRGHTYFKTGTVWRYKFRVVKVFKTRFNAAVPDVLHLRAFSVNFYIKENEDLIFFIDDII